MFIRSQIESKALSGNEAVLRAIFSQITDEIRKKGSMPNEEDGSFFRSNKFGWKRTVKEFFDVYHRICDRKQVTPIYQESKLTAANKVPYASIEIIRLLHDGVIQRLMQFKSHRIPPFKDLTDNPTTSDLIRTSRANREDKDISQFLDLVVLVDQQLREYVHQLDELVSAYHQRLDAFASIYNDSNRKTDPKTKEENSKRTITNILNPYITHLKTTGYLSSGWQYSYKKLPLTEEGFSFLTIRTMSSDIREYWENDTLPTKDNRKKREHERRRILKKENKLKARQKKIEEKEKSKKEKEYAKIKRGYEKSLRKIGHSKFSLSSRSPWQVYDKWVSDIGKWFAYKMDDISNWIMTSWIWLVIIYGLIIVIGVWINDGFFVALISAFLVLVFIGILQALTDIISVILKLITYIPLFILRYIFYRGWTLLLTILAFIIYYLYCYLKIKALI